MGTSWITLDMSTQALIDVSLLVVSGILQALSVDLAFQLLEAAEGLLYLHTRFEPVVHGDIKG